jgi:DNA-binding NtrC family response regulator
MNRRAVLVLSEDRTIREALLRLLANAGIAESCDGTAVTAILVGCRSRIARMDLENARALAHTGRIPIILVTAEGSEDLAVEALRAGIANYLRLPLTAADLNKAIEGIDNRFAAPARDRIVGVSQAIQDLKNYLRRVAASSSNVLITGETGTGKELAADFIHRHSSRSAQPLVTINCAAIPDSLIESELFGFERGAFTGAHAAQNGKFKLADGGAIFLDEIGDLSPWAQAKILRVIESGEIQRLGGRQPQRVDVRVIAATHRDLEHDPNFRRDLYFRLNVARVQLPPLRDRREDILPLADSFRAEFDRAFGRTTAFTSGAQALLLGHLWPGNVRELRNIVEAAFIDPGPDACGGLDLPAPFRKALGDRTGGELERILRALSQTHWNKSRAADELHWSRMTLYRKMARYKLSRAARNTIS